MREFEVLMDGAELGLRMDNVVNAPWGVSGGKSGRSGRFILNPGTPSERILARLSDGVQLKAGDILRIETPGGGGFGHPFDREPERVLEDVVNGLVTPAKALEDYGVVLADHDEAVDLAATEAHRKANGWETKMFHRGEYLGADEWFRKYRRVA